MSDDKLENNIPGTPNALPYETNSEESVHKKTTTWRLRKLISQFGKWGLEVNGIERIPPEHRAQRSTRDMQVSHVLVEHKSLAGGIH